MNHYRLELAQYISHPLEKGIPPAWASAWGDSRYGPWAAIEVDGVEYRLFWIPPGTFTMGSPEDEPGRYSNELQHQVTISSGFWMGETPCTQALWEAVMGNNPSEYKDPERPVESVSWEDTQKFFESLKSKLPNADMKLPTEAQWEYACRAGTTEATYAGPIDILGEHNASILDAIAWYGGNSGHYDFDLEHGYDSSDWLDKQYNHKQAATRKVKTRRRNPWGLCDMLGNVWEWCSDCYGDYEGSHAIDPIGAAEGADRVLRGAAGPTSLVTCVRPSVTTATRLLAPSTSVSVCPKVNKCAKQVKKVA